MRTVNNAMRGEISDPKCTRYYGCGPRKTFYFVSDFKMFYKVSAIAPILLLTDISTCMIFLIFLVV